MPPWPGISPPVSFTPRSRFIADIVKLGKLKLTVEQIINAVDPVALANERFAGPHAAQPHMRQPALDGKIRWMDHVELADKTLKLNQPVEIHRKRMRWRISTGSRLSR